MKKISIIITIIICLFLLTACEFNMRIGNPEGSTTNTQNELTQTSQVVDLPKTEDVTPEYTEVRASTAVDIFANIKPYTRIILTEPLYNISTIDVRNFENEYVAVEDAFDGYEFVIRNTNNVEICSAPNVMAEIATEGPHVNTISMNNCKNIKLDGIVAGHIVEKGSCCGAVVNIINCSDLELNNCHLYGCGTYGITSNGSSNVKVTNSEIYECSYGLIELQNSNNFVFDNCIFRDTIEYNMMSMNRCNNVTFNNCSITNNHAGMYSSFIYSDSCSNIQYNKCIFTNNSYTELTSNDDVQFNGCKFDDQQSGEPFYDYEYYEDSDYDYEYYDIEDDSYDL